MLKVSVPLRGIRAMQTAADRMRDRVVRAVVAAVRVEGGGVLRESDKNVPVLSGALRDSGHTLPVETSPSSISVTIRYGEGKSAAYAAAVHEHPSSASPPSWKGEVRFRRGGPKYLLRALQSAASGMDERLAGRVRSRLGGGGGGVSVTGGGA